MGLHGDVKAALGVGDDGATRALGTVFRAVRMTMNVEQFRAIQVALPEVEAWLRAAPIGGGRTAEMLAIVGPEALARSLEDLGLTDDQIEKLYGVVARRLARDVPELATRVGASLPVLKA